MPANDFSTLERPIQFLKGVGPKWGEALQRMGILTIGLLAAVVFYFAKINVNILKITLWVLVVGTAVTAMLRLGRLYRQLP